MHIWSILLPIGLFTAIWSILLPFYGNLLYYSRFGMSHQEKSGKLAREQLGTHIHRRLKKLLRNFSTLAPFPRPSSAVINQSS
jgi:hypothetical protein